MKRTVAVICTSLTIGVLVLFHSSVGADAELTTPLIMTLTGAAEVPPVDNGYAGTARVVLTTASLTTVMCVELTLDLAPGDGFAGIHVNRGPEGVDGPVEIPLAPVQDHPTSACSSNNLYGSSVLSEMIADPAEFYLEVDTEQSPDGAVRGQLVPAAAAPSTTSSSVAPTTTAGAAPAVNAAAAFTG